MADTKYVTLEELAEHVGVKVSTVRQWVKRGFVPRSTYIKAGNTYRFCVEDVVIAVDLEKNLREPNVEEMLSELDDDF